MDLGLNGRVAIVGGGSKGLGKACALSLAREGAKVAICSRSVDDLEAAAQEIRAETGGDVLVVPGDLSTLSGIQNFIQTTVDHFGRLDVVVSNSGGPAGRAGGGHHRRNSGSGLSRWPSPSSSGWAGNRCRT